MTPNPFKVLGLDPDILRGLSDKKIRLLVESQWKTLQKIHHTDLGGNKIKSQAVNEAHDELKNLESFKYWRERFLRKSSAKRKIDDLEKKLDRQADGRVAMHQAMLSCITAVPPNPANQIPTIFIPCRLDLQDYIKCRCTPSIMRPGKNDGLFVTLELKSDFSITKREQPKLCLNQEKGKKPEERLYTSSDLTQEFNSRKKILIGTIALADIQTSNMGNDMSELLAHIPVRAENIAGTEILPTNKKLKLKIPFADDSEERPYLERDKTPLRIYLDDFSIIAHLIRPVLKKYSYLFSLNDPLGDAPYIVLEGQIIREPEIIT